MSDVTPQTGLWNKQFFQLRLRELLSHVPILRHRRIDHSDIESILTLNNVCGFELIVEEDSVMPGGIA